MSSIVGDVLICLNILFQPDLDKKWRQEYRRRNFIIMMMKTMMISVVGDVDRRKFEAKQKFVRVFLLLFVVLLEYQSNHFLFAVVVLWKYQPDHFLFVVALEDEGGSDRVTVVVAVVLDDDEEGETAKTKNY